MRQGITMFSFGGNTAGTTSGTGTSTNFASQPQQPQQQTFNFGTPSTSTNLFGGGK